LEYYRDGTKGTLQGQGSAGGLGILYEFFESIMVPQIMLYGFLGLKAEAGRILLDPAIPSEPGKLKVTGIRYHGTVFDIEVKDNEIVVAVRSGDAAALVIEAPEEFKVFIVVRTL
jgi:cellobiose phosphorylase